MNLFRKLVVACFCVFSMLACVTTKHSNFPPPAPEIKKIAHKTIVFHTDITFNDRERHMLDEVAGYIFEQTAGILKVEYIYDLDAKNIVFPVGPIENNKDILVKTNSQVEYIKNQDTAKSYVLGFTYVDLEIIDIDAPTQVYIVVDRLKFPVLFEHVVFHEILHALRFRHLNDKNAVMFWATHGEFPSLCMNKADVEELCRIYDCRPVKLNPCD